MRELSVPEMQTVEIAKALAHEAEVIIMDEPTSALSAREVEALFGIIDDLRRQGVAVIYISHKLEEVFRVAEVATVLRDGRYVDSQPIETLTRDKLIELMAGRRHDANHAGQPGMDQSLLTSAATVQDEEALSVSSLSSPGRFHNISFTARRGEVLGLAGLMGAGRTELVSALYGLAPAETGEIRVQGRPARIRAPRDAIRNGIALASEDRKRFGLVLPMSVKENITLANLRCCCRGWLIRRGAEDRLADDRIRQFGVKTPGRHTPAGNLSGGNQQKIVLAKALLADPDVLLLDEPTRGIDINAKAEVHALIRQLAQSGKAILLVSSELPELFALSDRILVMREGSITAERDPRLTTPGEVLRLAMPE
jgi:ABC-type sugar transport system ATPase subunit